MSNFPTTEKGRIDSYTKRKEIDVMIEYLVKRPEQEDVGASVHDIILWT